MFMIGAGQNKDEEIKALQQEVADLKKYKDAAKFQSSIKGKLSIFGIRIWAGPELNKAFSSFLKKDKSDGTVPVEETADLAAAVVKRFIRVGFILCLLALVPSTLHFWQNLIMKEQNASLIEQIKAQREASEDQQITIYTNLLLSGGEEDAANALSFFLSDKKYRNSAFTRMANVVWYGKGESRCRALDAIASLLRSEFGNFNEDNPRSLEEALNAVQNPENRLTRLANLKCSELDLSLIDIGKVQIDYSSMENTDFTFTNLSKSKAVVSNFDGSIFRETIFCSDTNDSCFRAHRGSFRFSEFRSISPTIGEKKYDRLFFLSSLTGSDFDQSTLNSFKILFEGETPMLTCKEMNQQHYNYCREHYKDEKEKTEICNDNIEYNIVLSNSCD